MAGREGRSLPRVRVRKDASPLLEVGLPQEDGNPPLRHRVDGVLHLVRRRARQHHGAPRGHFDRDARAPFPPVHPVPSAVDLGHEAPPEDDLPLGQERGHDEGPLDQPRVRVVSRVLPRFVVVGQKDVVGLFARRPNAAAASLFARRHNAARGQGLSELERDGGHGVRRERAAFKRLALRHDALALVVIEARAGLEVPPRVPGAPINGPPAVVRDACVGVHLAHKPCLEGCVEDVVVERAALQEVYAVLKQHELLHPPLTRAVRLLFLFSVRSFSNDREPFT
eukprot:CAMPEP_0171628786 /NCGR_PEP_ID=MMETSP0990-20121206/21703_1 /TAXON_ID=483369 /ORGANISM="non described non described, Strain CCMP2098" /LENGTH=281 /DNA_ID=CAMNT_0012197155 /DNA_START=235 /DNA_END=1078 /DNA_ORIENTATION=-